MSLVSREKGMLRSSVESNESRVVEFISVGSDGDFLVACEVLVRGMGSSLIGVEEITRSSK